MNRNPIIYCTVGHVHHWSQVYITTVTLIRRIKLMTGCWEWGAYLKEWNERKLFIRNSECSKIDFFSLEKKKHLVVHTFTKKNLFSTLAEFFVKNWLKKLSTISPLSAPHFQLPLHRKYGQSIVVCEHGPPASFFMWPLEVLNGDLKKGNGVCQVHL